jgi:Skp family chaperone for outer membrane proteins
LLKEISVFIRLLILLTFAVTLPAAPVNVVIVDTRDAYTRVNALKALFAQVDERVRAARTEYDRGAQPIQAELETLKTSKMEEGQKRKLKASLLLRLADLQKRASTQQAEIGRANEAALTRFEAAQAGVLEELRQAKGASALLQAQETLHYRLDCPCNVTEEFYQRINAKLPKLELGAAAGKK